MQGSDDPVLLLRHLLVHRAAAEGSGAKNADAPFVEIVRSSGIQQPPVSPQRAPQRSPKRPSPALAHADAGTAVPALALGSPAQITVSAPGRENSAHLAPTRNDAPLPETEDQDESDGEGDVEDDGDGDVENEDDATNDDLGAARRERQEKRELLLSAATRLSELVPMHGEYPRLIDIDKPIPIPIFILIVIVVFFFFLFFFFPFDFCSGQYEDDVSFVTAVVSAAVTVLR